LGERRESDASTEINQAWSGAHTQKDQRGREKDVPSGKKEPCTVKSIAKITFLPRKRKGGESGC